MSQTANDTDNRDPEASSPAEERARSSKPLPTLYCDSVDTWKDMIQATTSEEERCLNPSFWDLDPGPIAVGQSFRRAGYSYRPDHSDMRWALNQSAIGAIDLQLQHASYYHRAPGHFWYSSAGVTITDVPPEIPPLSLMSDRQRAKRIASWLDGHVQGIIDASLERHEVALAEHQSLSRFFGPDDLHFYDHARALRMSAVLSPEQLEYLHERPTIETLTLYKAGTGKYLGHFDGGPNVIIGPETGHYRPPEAQVVDRTQRSDEASREVSSYEDDGRPSQLPGEDYLN